MTNEELRALDAEIAEKVMGWTKRISADHTSSPIKALRAMGIIYAWKDDKGKERGLDVPHYSTDISAAWQLIEHHPHYVSLTRSVDVSRFGFADHATWKCRFYAPQSFEAEADTAPLAICRAALLGDGRGEGI